MSTIPLKEQRTKCWAAKDSYWECLDNNQQASEKCAELKEAFNASCSKTWVKYFERRRDYLIYKEKIEKNETGGT